MKKLLLLVTVVALGLGASGCAAIVWNSPFYETATAGDAEKFMADVGAKEVGKYTTVLNLFWLGYETYQGLVASEMRKGNKTYHVVRTNYYFWSVTKGYIVDR
jgi:hypothetical protein